MGADSRTQTAIPPVDFHSSWPLVMNKRSFIKLFSGMLAGPAVSPLLALLPDSKLKNWAGNVEYGTENLYTVNSLEQARDFVRKQSKFKVLGTRHCFNKIADSTNQFLSLKSIDEMVALNAEEHTVSGCRISAWALPQARGRSCAPGSGLPIWAFSECCENPLFVYKKQLDQHHQKRL